MEPRKCSKIIKENGSLIKPDDVAKLRIKPTKKSKQKPKSANDNFETFVHLVKSIIGEFPITDKDGAIVDMEEHYDLAEFCPF